MTERLLILTLFLTGFAGMVVSRNLIRKIFGLAILNSAVVILFVTEGAQIGKSTPITGSGVNQVVDPIPQALMLTAIVVGVCLTALALAMVHRIFKACKTLEVKQIRERMQHDIS